MKLKSKLNDVIKHKGYQKQWLAEKVGVSKTQFAHWCTNDNETGFIKAVPSVLNAIILSKILGCNVEELFELVEDE
jgi:putative transcriptional regulator